MDNVDMPSPVTLSLAKLIENSWSFVLFRFTVRT